MVLVFLFLKTRSEIERKKEVIAKLIKKWGLSVAVDTNLKTVSFLDVAFDSNLLESAIISPLISIKTQTTAKCFETAAKINHQTYIENILR